MLKKILTPALAGLFLVTTFVSRAETVSQDFAGNPLTNGWAVFGDASLFTWDATNQNLRVTWDSTHSNSYYYRPLNVPITRYDDFQIDFDLTLTDCISGTEPDKTGPLQIGIGLFNFASATNTDFGRGNFGHAPNMAEFNYFPYGYYTFGSDIFVSKATTTCDFISGGGYAYAPTYFKPYYEFELPTNTVHVAMKYTSRNQALDLTITSNSVVVYHPPNVVLNDPGNSGFSVNDDYVVNTISISSYSSQGDDYDSVLGHGTVDNLSVTVNRPVAQNINAEAFGGVWQAQIHTQTNWFYTLERSLDLSSWTNVSPTFAGTAGNLSLQDTNPPAGKAYYRVHTSQP